MTDAEALLAAQGDVAFGTPGVRSARSSRLYSRYIKMHRVFGQVDDRNAAVQNLFGRLGFRCEAREVESDWVQGRVDHGARVRRA